MDKKADTEDWLMVEYYRKIRSKYGCKMCEKTHFTKDCKYLKERDDPKKEIRRIQLHKDSYINTS